MIVKQAEFVKSATKPSQYPEAGLPEMAFTGRSNVGKSSLINTLVNRKRLVKTSSKPGHTRLINFFLINGNRYFVDLPGYGFAKVPNSEKKKWGPMVENYLTNRPTLKGVVLLTDIRRDPGAQELEFINWLAYHRIPVILVLTKADKLSRSKCLNRRKAVTRQLEIEQDDMILFSAKSGHGKELLLNTIGELMHRE